MTVCERILKDIDPSVIHSSITSPCKRLENTFQPKHLFPKEFPEFQEDCASYYNHLNSGYLKLGSHSMPFNYALGYATQIIDNSLGDNGGMRYAYEQCLHYSFTFAKNHITSSYIYDMKSKYVYSILRRHVNPNSYKEISDVISDYIRIFDVRLDSEGDKQLMISHYESVFQSHVHHYEGLDIDRKMGRIVR